MCSDQVRSFDKLIQFTYVLARGNLIIFARVRNSNYPSIISIQTNHNNIARESPYHDISAKWNATTGIKQNTNINCAFKCNQWRK